MSRRGKRSVTSGEQFGVAMRIITPAARMYSDC
jgi:hypothetical protein